MTHRATFTLILLLTTFSLIWTQLAFPKDSGVKVSAAETEGNIGIYWDKSCSQEVSSINWGVLSLGETKKFTVYVRNEGNETFLLVLNATNWSPFNASRYLSFSWSSEYKRIQANAVVKVTLYLFVSPYTTGISNFRFDINFEGREFLMADLDGDGVVTILDVSIVCRLFGLTSQDYGWNPDADLRKDYIIDIHDIVIVAKDFGMTL